ncbi:MAG TPA: NAD(P)/FAD-dependent oxidoreductase [Gaiellaceae bacterium]|nr:NAD(P)/FAD-dependent oxidoreductase [Gaiellaceae bacterium]
MAGLTRPDAIVVGAGVNGLAAAVVLARAGRRVLVFERADEPGGAVRTGEVTLPGFRHDLYATNLNLFAGSRLFAEVGAELRRFGFDLVASSRPFCSAFPDGRVVGVSTDSAETLASIRAVSGPDARAWQQTADWFGRVAPHVFGLLGEPMPSLGAARALLRGATTLGRRWPLELARLALQSSRAFVEERFESPELHALVASWGMHLDLPPDVGGGALFCFLETFASAAKGMVLGRGGARVLPDALAGLLASLGGELVCGAEVDRIVVERGRATGVVLRGGERHQAPTVIANLTPAALGRLVDLPRSFARFRYGPGTLMVHLALDGPVPWRAAEAGGFAYVHVGPYLDDMSLAYQRALAGLLPERPTLVVGQPTVVDPSRAPAGKHVLWIQARVVPGRIKGDAAGELTATDWDEAKEPVSDRVLALLEEHAPGLGGLVLGRHVLSPADLERANPNLVGGDQLGGSHHPSQGFFLRPVPGWSRYRTPIEGLYVCGAGTWPGAGVGAGSGYLLGKRLAS